MPKGREGRERKKTEEGKERKGKFPKKWRGAARKAEKNKKREEKGGRM